MPGATKTKIKYALLGSAIPLAFLFGRSLVTKKHSKLREASADANITIRADDALERYIGLPHGGPGAGFRVREFVDHIELSGRGYIIVGEVDCALADHPKPSSLDYWLRGDFGRNKETKQATTEVSCAVPCNRRA